MTSVRSLSRENIDKWAEDDNDTVALTLKQKLVPVEGEGAVIFPPTYAEVGYNIDELSDGTKVVTIDSVGAQANRLEPIFETQRFAELVPQVHIAYGNARKISLLEAGHRLGDAIVRCTELKKEAREAFEALQMANDASAIAKLAPTSLVFGVWDSRDTHAKLPRIVQSVIRAWNVEPLTRSAQYFPPVDYADPEAGFISREKKEEEEEKAARSGEAKSPEAKRGYVAVPAVKTHGGVVARGGIERTVTVNLIALRRLRGNDLATLRQYVLGLSMVAATEPVEAFLRQGCLLTPDPESPGVWEAVARNGVRSVIALNAEVAESYAKSAAKAFGVGGARTVHFDKKLAEADLEEAGGAKSGKQRKAS